MTIDVRVLLFTAGVAIVAMLICGLAPAWLLSRIDLRDALASVRGEAGGSAQSRLRRLLVTAQVALALDLEGLDSHATVIPAAPSVASDEPPAASSDLFEDEL